MAISPDGKWLATTSNDNAARIWDASTHREYVRLHFTDAPGAVAFTPDGRLLAIAHGNSVTLEPWRTEDLVHDLSSRMTRNLTFAEWKQYLGNEPYRRTCLNLPAPEQAKAGGQ